MEKLFLIPLMLLATLVPDAVLKANLQRLKQTLASDEELAPYGEDILWRNAERLFERNDTESKTEKMKIVVLTGLAYSTTTFRNSVRT